jgi:hypothetical protein
MIRFFSSVAQSTLSFPKKAKVLETLAAWPIDGLGADHMTPFFERIAKACANQTMTQSQCKNLVREDFLNYVYPHSHFDYLTAVDHVVKSLKKYKVES